MIDPKTILVLAPHTDDGELGCGGSLARFAAEGKQVFYAAFSLCSRSLPEGLAPDTLATECTAATHQLGIPADHLQLFDFEVREFAARRQMILDEMVGLNRRIQPDLVFTPCAADIHQDHGVIHAESLRAFKNCSMLGYELPWNHPQFSAPFYLSLTAEQVASKWAALQQYRSQAHRPYMQEDFIRSLARVRGILAGTEWAEAFEVYRMIG